jgi:hypothetical protein
MSTKLKKFSAYGWGFYINKDLGYYPRFTFQIMKRIKQKKGTNIVCTGEGGIGKTYICNDICRTLNKHFSIDQIVFTYADFLRSVISTRMGVPIVFDEPSYAMGKREWYKELNQALVKTIESMRFKVHPLFIPIINKSLLDKTVRSFLIQYQIFVKERGKATVYRLEPSQFEDKTYRYIFCKLDYPLFDTNICKRDSCLGCSKLFDKNNPCQIFRAQYERKKASTQEERYEQALEDADKKEVQALTMDQLEAKAMLHIDKMLNKEGFIDVKKLKIILARDENIRIGLNRYYDLKALIEYDFPQYSQQ